MCQFRSGLIFKNRTVLAPITNESHSRLLESLGIEDSQINAMKTFVRAELTPPDGDFDVNVDNWKHRVDQDVVPDWYAEDPGRYESDFRAAVAEWVKENIVIVCGKSCILIKRDEMGTYYLLLDDLFKRNFGKTNNYATSFIREKLMESDFCKELKDEFGDRLVPIHTDLLSHDGLDDYGVVDGDILAVPTYDLYRECRKKIPNLKSWWWLATPDSTPSGCGARYVRCVDGDGYVGCGWYDYARAVRPFFILKS